MDKWKVIYFVSSSGNSPVKDFLDANLKVKVKALRIFSNCFTLLLKRPIKLP